MQPRPAPMRRVTYADASAGRVRTPERAVHAHRPAPIEGRAMAGSGKTTDTTTPPSLWRRIRSVHPALVLAALDLVGLGIASYLSVTELSGGRVQCGILQGCQKVQDSPYTRPVAGIPV